MSYQPGNKGVAGGISLVIMLTFPFIFLTTPAQTVERGAGLAWLIPLLAAVPPISIVWGLSYVLSNFKGDLYTVSKILLGRVGAWLVTLYYISLFFLDAILLSRQFAENTLLTALPKAEFSVIILVYLGVAAVLCYAGLEAMVRANYIITPFSILALVLVLLLLAPYYNIYNLAPWQGTGLEKVIPSAFLVAGAQAGVLALIILAPNFQKLSSIKIAAVFGIGLSSMLKSATVLVFTLVFGVGAAQEKVLPFFEMARLVYLSRYIQRIESLFIVLWVIAGVLAIAINLYIGLYLITRLLNLPTLRPLIPIASILLAQAAMLPPDIATIIVLDGILITTYFNIGLYIIPSILIIAALLKKRKKEAIKCAG
ncbi:MAG: GerAB/ArcD/ProY family transporter [Veillonellaceae bacterium]|nr:GerAB/ArcD/ProY family transporter [Veillonellaceae bacterium]